MRIYLVSHYDFAQTGGVVNHVFGPEQHMNFSGCRDHISQRIMDFYYQVLDSASKKEHLSGLGRDLVTGRP